MRDKNSNMSMESARLSIGRRELLRGVAVATAFAGSLTRAKAEIWEEGEAQCRPTVQEVDPVYQVDDALLADFLKLSEALTGAKPLSPQLGTQYLERYARHPELTGLLPKLVDAYRNVAGKPGTPGYGADIDQKIDQAIMQDKTLRPGAEQLIYLWYVSAFLLPLGGEPAKRIWIYGSREQYERGLLWSVVHAHAPMTRGGPYGYWATPPAGV